MACPLPAPAPPRSQPSSSAARDGTKMPGMFRVARDAEGRAACTAPGRRHYEGRSLTALSPGSRAGAADAFQLNRCGSRAPARGEGSRGRAWCPPGREPPALHPAAPGGQRPPSLPTRGKEPRPGPGAARRRGARRHFSPMLWSFHGKRPWSEAEWSCVCARVCAQACACELVRARTRTRSFSPSAE